MNSKSATEKLSEKWWSKILPIENKKKWKKKSGSKLNSEILSRRTCDNKRSRDIVKKQHDSIGHGGNLRFESNAKACAICNTEIPCLREQ